MIYLINLESTSLYKIGKSKNPTKRLKYLQTAASFPLILVKEFHTGVEENDMERTAHRAYAYYKTSGEWYDFDHMEISKVIENIKDIQKNLIFLRSVKI